MDEADKGHPYFCFGLRDGSFVQDSRDALLKMTISSVEVLFLTNGHSDKEEVLYHIRATLARRAAPPSVISRPPNNRAYIYRSVCVARIAPMFVGRKLERL